MLIFADTMNFRPRNFPALFRTIELERIPVDFVRWGDKAAKHAFGNYAGVQQHLQPHMKELRKVALPSLVDVHHRGVWLFDVCRYELLQHLMTRPAWYDENTPNEPQVIFDKAVQEASEEVFRNVAAARFWVDFWHELLTARNESGPHTVAIFGNSLSYTRALTAQAETLRVVPLVFEHFFTGHDHYMEARKSPIQGFNELRLDPPASCTPDPRLVYRRLAEARNKNVQQGGFRRLSPSRRGNRRVLLLAQVVNDFAALTPGNRRLGTVAIYKELLDLLLRETDLDVVVKAHPYEARKTGFSGPITYDELRAFVAARGADARARVTVVDNFPIEGLFCDADLVVTLHSQGGLEALAAGLPVATLGNPFYGGKGFTHDFDEPAELVESLVTGSHIFVHDDQQRERYLAFMTHCFRTLVNRNEPTSRVVERLAAFGVYPGLPEGPVSEPPEGPVSESPEGPASRPPESADGPPPVAGTPSNGSGRTAASFPAAKKARKLLKNPRGFFADALSNLATRIQGNDES